MPLRKGSDKRTIELNVRQLIREGYPAAQARAIAESVAAPAAVEEREQAPRRRRRRKVSK